MIVRITGMAEDRILAWEDLLTPPLVLRIQFAMILEGNRKVCTEFGKTPASNRISHCRSERMTEFAKSFVFGSSESEP